MKDHDPKNKQNDVNNVQDIRETPQVRKTSVARENLGNAKEKIRREFDGNSTGSVIGEMGAGKETEMGTNPACEAGYGGADPVRMNHDQPMWTGKKRIAALLLSVAVPLAVGGLASLITGNAMQQFNIMEKPPLSPPAWLFPVAWTILYVLMGIACYLIITTDPETGVEQYGRISMKGRKAYDGLSQYKAIQKMTISRRIAIVTYTIQLIFNFVWSLIFFGTGMYFTAFIWLMILWLMIIVLMKFTHEVKPIAAYLLAPYLIWCTFAAYLNVMIAVLN